MLKNGKKNTEYIDCDEKENEITWFWEIIKEEIEKGRKDIVIKLYEFTTGSCRQSPDISSLKFSITKKDIDKCVEINSFPTPISNTCQKRITLYEYPNKETMRERLFTAIKHPRDFSRTAAY